MVGVQLSIWFVLIVVGVLRDLFGLPTYQHRVPNDQVEYDELLDGSDDEDGAVDRRVPTRKVP